MSWAVIEQLSPAGQHVAYHVVPAVRYSDDMEPVMSAAHQLSSDCPCHPTAIPHPATTMWNHHDPEHPGSNERVAAGDYPDSLLPAQLTLM